MTISSLSDDDIALAGEAALGLLDPASAARASARIATDPAFAAEVDKWAERLTPMLGQMEEAAPDHVWHALKTQLSPSMQQDNNRTPLRFWQGLSAVSTAAALLLGIMTLTRPGLQPAEPRAPLVAALGSTTGPAAITASYDPGSGNLTLTPVNMETGKLYPELWVIPAGGTAHSLGIVISDRPSQVTLSANLRTFLDKGATLAITPEPAGGAPNGKATGPIIASGTITTI
jgi:anti-sigma-K factor RskA